MLLTIYKRVSKWLETVFWIAKSCKFGDSLRSNTLSLKVFDYSFSHCININDCLLPDDVPQTLFFPQVPQPRYCQNNPERCGSSNMKLYTNWKFKQYQNQKTQPITDSKRKPIRTTPPPPTHTHTLLSVSLIKTMYLIR